MSKFNGPGLVGEVQAEREPIILRSKLSVTVDVPKDMCPLWSDRQKVKQILLNLLSNALKFTHQGSVTLSARPNPRERVLELAVTDTGIGVALVDQEKI